MPSISNPTVPYQHFGSTCLYIFNFFKYSDESLEKHICRKKGRRIILCSLGGRCFATYNIWGKYFYKFFLIRIKTLEIDNNTHWSRLQKKDQDIIFTFTVTFTVKLTVSLNITTGCTCAPFYRLFRTNYFMKILDVPSVYHFIPRSHGTILLKIVCILTTIWNICLMKVCVFANNCLEQSIKWTIQKYCS